MNKPKILLIADHPEWAYDHICNFIIRCLRDRYEFFVDYLLFNKNYINDKSLNNIQKIKLIVNKYCKYIKYYKKRKLLRNPYMYDIICYLGFYFPFSAKFNYKSKYIIQGIYTSGFPPQGCSNEDNGIDIKQFINKYLFTSSIIIAGSKEIYNFYKPYLSDKIYLATGAIDTNLFKPSSDRKINKSPKFVIGWTGNPTRKFKGYWDYILPAIKKIRVNNPNIKFKTRFSGSFNTLPHFYNNVDIVLLASIGDAGPSCFLEAGACGVPAISIKSGFPGETIIDGFNGLIVERNIDSIIKAIDYVYCNRELLWKMSLQIRKDIVKEYSYESRYINWVRVFDKLIDL